LIEDKRVDLLLQAFDRVSSDETLGIIGEGPMREELETQVASLESEHRITFTGFLEEYEDVLSQMRAADVFASPSTREGFGLTYAEAMAADCTVIAADHPDSAADEVIGDAGFLADPTPEGVAKVLSRALEGERPPVDPMERAKRYSWDRIAEDALTTYQDAVDRTW
jgi:glycosyltransferase involved in cell wall biosynthesis